jgi:hypothetical protein
MDDIMESVFEHVCNGPILLEILKCNISLS